jgi:uncharacterized RDD family membrane protein YckC
MRRLTAMSYDLMLVIAVVIIGGFAFLTLTGGEAVDTGPMRWVFQIYLLLLIGGFYGFFWLRGGQTLGLRAWRLQVTRLDGQPMDLAHVLRRLLAAVVTLGPLGLISVPFHRRGLSLTDLLAGSAIRRIAQRD